MGDKKEYLVVFVTVDGMNTANKISEYVVSNSLAACVNIIQGVTSVYSWKNEIARDKEFLLIMKTRKELFKALEQEIIRLHPYEVPEIIGMDVAKGHVKYLDWIDRVTCQKPKKK
ncbi:MAG: divalent-cation tolerance protein CutA [Deltaproteobacteria bacterium]|nr:divalent-cation tolerance protein CutA [Deltaproteobacteria bacterium]